MISFRYLSNDVIRPSASSIITSLRWFLHIEHFPCGVDEPFLLFIVTLFLLFSLFPPFFCIVFELQVEFLLDGSHETRMTEYPHSGHPSSIWIIVLVHRLN